MINSRPATHDRSLSRTGQQQRGWDAALRGRVFLSAKGFPVATRGCDERGDRGLSLIESVLVVTVIAIVAVVALPGFDAILRAAALNAVSSQLKGLLYRCRADAVMNGRATAAVFDRQADGSWKCYVAVDGDGDGVTSRDIRALIDPVVGEVLHFETNVAGLGILQTEFVPDPSGRGRLRGDLSDPVRAGRGGL